MKPAPLPENEAERLEALRKTRLLDSAPDSAFDDFTRLASFVCGTPVALISLIDEDRQWFKSRIGLDATETPRHQAFCAHAILGTEVFEVPDSSLDERFVDNPLAIGYPHVRFYAGAPLVTPEGHALGTLCVIDDQPRSLSDTQRDALSTIARQVMVRIELQRKAEELARATMEREREWRVIERLKNEFISTVSHELRTPLTSIRGSLGLVEAGVAGALPEQALDLVRIAKNNTERLIRLINDILDLEKMEAGKLELVLRDVDAASLVALSVEGIEGMAREAGVTLSVEAHGGGLVHADGDRLVQVLTNLVSNAIKFSPSGGRVRVRLDRPGPGRVRVSVTDSGDGIPEALRGKLFEKFSQLDGSDRRAKGGTGLGLAISKAIVEQHQGAIGVDSTVGAGSTFWFELPLVTRPSFAGDARAASAPGRRTILLVEDDDDLARVLRRMLVTEGYRLVRAATLAEAEELLAYEQPSVVLLDLQLPDGNGLELMRHLKSREETAGIPVIVVSGRGPTENGYGGACQLEWITKPFDRGRLLSAVRNAVRMPGSPRALIVDDDPSARAVLAALLRPLGVDSIEAATGTEAVALARSEQPDIIILDVTMPEMDGFEVAEILRGEKARTTPLVVYTGRDLSAAERDALTLGVTRHLTKARATEEEFVGAVRDLLNGLLAGHGGDRPEHP